MTTCSRCGAAATGNFCSACGASLKKRGCARCGASLESGARFCNQCGSAVAEAAPVQRERQAAVPASRARSTAGAGRTTPPEPKTETQGPPAGIGWWLAGAFMVGVALILALPILRREEVQFPPPAQPAGAGAAAPDISAMTPAEAAERLFDRVMRAEAAGDRQQVEQFLPMAIAAHDRARPLDLDQVFHLALLHQAGGDHAAALAVAREGLEREPAHLLALAAAAESARALGDEAAARAYYETFLDAYDQEMARELEEYDAHIASIADARSAARRVTGR